MRAIKLTSDELAVENELDNLRPLSGQDRKRIENILAESKKNRSISLRISSFDLEKLKQKANDQGMPYQTLINSVLHKYITNQLYERDEVIKSFQLLNKE